MAVQGPAAEEFALRYLQDSDADVCEAIARVTYNGRDYLMHALPTWLAHPETHVCLVLADPATDKLAAIEVMKLIDDGETGWFEGLRTHPDYRNRGLARRLSQELLAVALRMFRERGLPRRLRLTARASNTPSIRIAESSGFSPIRAWGFCEIPLTPTFDERFAAALDRTGARGLPAADVISAETFIDAALADPRLRCHEYLNDDWKIFKTGLPAIAALHESHPTLQLLATRSASGEVTGLSIGRQRRDAIEGAWSVTINAGGHVATALLHLQAHVERARGAGVGSLLLLYDDDLIDSFAGHSEVSDADGRHLQIATSTMASDPASRAILYEADLPSVSDRVAMAAAPVDSLPSL